MDEKVFIFRVSDGKVDGFLGITEDSLQRISKLAEMLRESKDVLINKATRIRYDIESTVYVGMDLSEEFAKIFDPTTDKKSIPLNFPGFRVVSKDNNKNNILITDKSTLRDEEYFRISNDPFSFSKVDFSYLNRENSRTCFFAYFETDSGCGSITYFLSGSTFFTDSIEDLLECCKI